MRRALRITAWLLGSLLALVFLVGGALLIIGNTESGRALVVRTTRQLTGGKVQLAGIHGSFPAALDLDRLELSDDRGVWLHAEHISLRWSPAAILTRHVLVDSLRIGLLHIERAPVTQPTNTPSGEFSFPHTDISRLAIDALELGPSLAGVATSLVVNGSAHWRSLRDAMASVVAQRTGGIGHYEVQLRFNADRMDATVKLQEPAHGPLENLLQVPGLGALSVLAQLSGPRTAEHLQLTLDAGELRGRAQGDINLMESSADLEYSLTAPAMTPYAGLSWESVDLQGRWHGTLTTPAADGHLRARRLQIPGGTQLAALAADFQARDGGLTFHGIVDGLIVPGPQPKLFQDSPLTVDASARLSDAKRPVELTATHRLFALKAHVTTAGEQSAQLSLRLPDVAPFAALGGETIRGDATIQAQIVHDSTATRLTADADGRIDGGAAAWAGMVRGGNTRLQITGALSNDKITIDRLQLNGRTLSLAASGSVARSATQDLDARLDVSLTDLAALSPALAGTLKLSGKVKGPAHALSTTADLTTTVSIHGSPQGTIAASIRADGLPNTPRGTVAAHGALDGAPLRLDLDLEQNKGNLFHAVIRQADWKSAHADGDFTSGTDIARARGKLQFRMTELSDLDRLLGSALRGSIAGHIELTPGGRQSRAQIDVEAHNVVAGGIAADAKLTANGPVDALDLHLDAQSPAIGGEPASVATTAQLNVSGKEVRLATLDAQYHGQTVKLLAPATVALADGLSITNLKLSAQQAELDVDGRISPELDLRASLQQVKPELVNAFVPGLLASGTIQATAQLHGTTAAPSGKIHVEATGVRGANDAARGLPSVELHADADLMESTALVNAKLTAGTASHLTLQGNAPLAAAGKLDLKLAGNLDMGLLNPLLEASGKHVTGALTVDTTITGAAADPEIEGTVRLANGSMKDYTQGINLTEIAGEFVGDHGTLLIKSLTARAAPGNVSISGTIGVLQPRMPVDIKLTAKNAQPIASNILTANMDADVHVTGTAREKLDVSGTVHVNRANVEIPGSFPPNVAVLDVRRPGKPKPPPPEKPLIINLSLTLDAPRQILVKGRGLDSELGGQIRIRGTAAAPLVSGSFDLQRGTFSLASNPLTFSQGTVTFNGEGLKHKIDPTLDFVAQTQVVDVTVTVRITGFADAPKIELSSTPDLPQDEIMARLLFGESASQLTAAQVVQIGAALATLSGGGGSSLNPLAKIQKTLGLDRLTVGSGPNTGTSTTNQANTGYSVEAGRYVSSRVFVAVKESTTGTSQLAVDVDLTKHLKLQTRLGNGSTTAQGTTPENDPGSSVGLAYQFEY
ncbi:MAG TPA: translocation/assembly module TamB domain-containing protein [Steroidobacteraceae bacterium]|nr:translocation/assembly module TamB domain-containing protein [Steroidobacteraceae bacterium]